MRLIGNPSGSIRVTMCPPPGALVSSVIPLDDGNCVALALTLAFRVADCELNRPTSPNPDKTPPRTTPQGTPSDPFSHSKRTDQFRSLDTKSDHLFSSRFPFQSLCLSVPDSKYKCEEVQRTLKKLSDLIKIRMLVSHMRQFNQSNLSIGVDIASLPPGL